MGLLLFVLPYVCSFFVLSRFFVKDISTTVLDRNFKFGIEVRNDKLYCEIANRHSPICSSLPFSFFPDFSSKISPQPFKIETSNLVYRFTTTSCIVESKMGLLLFVLPYICSFFCLFRIFVEDISTAVQDRIFKFGIEICNDKLYCGIANRHSPMCSFLYLFLFLSLQIFCQKISAQPFKIETSYLVYWFTTTGNNMGLKMGTLLFVVPCIFLSLYIFRLRYQPYALEALKRGYSQIFCQF